MWVYLLVHIFCIIFVLFQCTFPIKPSDYPKIREGRYYIFYYNIKKVRKKALIIFPYWYIWSLLKRNKIRGLFTRIKEVKLDFLETSYFIVNDSTYYKGRYYEHYIDFYKQVVMPVLFNKQ